jgi:multidrug efflux pump subunit AcrB
MMRRAGLGAALVAASLASAALAGCGAGDDRTALPPATGATTYSRIAIEQYPSVELPFVTVFASYPGADPASMETKVARPIEDAVSSMGGIKRLRSFNFESLTEVVIEFQLAVDADRAVQGVRDRLATIPDLPEEVGTPKVQKYEIGAAPILSLSLSGALPPRELTRLAEDVVKPRLGRIQGVGNLEIVGGRPREIHVVIDPARLAARGLTVGDVGAALERQNLELPAGRNRRRLARRGAAPAPTDPDDHRRDDPRHGPGRARPRRGRAGRAPMAVVVIGGLITSTLLTLVVVPVVFSLIEGLRDRLRRARPPEAVVVGRRPPSGHPCPPCRR